MCTYGYKKFVKQYETANQFLKQQIMNNHVACFEKLLKKDI